MEHRWNERKPVTLDVHIYHAGIPVALCRTRDVSLGGMQISVGPLGFYKNTPLEIEFALERGGRLRRYRLPSCVVHCSRNRMGVLVHDADSEAYAALRELVSGEAVKPIGSAGNTRRAYPASV